MSLYVPSGTSPLVVRAVARIDRRLPQAGEVLVRVGKRVDPDDIVARAFVPGTPQILNIARALAISPALVPRAMRREVGNKVMQGEVLARSSRIGGRVSLAPISGQITAIDDQTGYVTITPERENRDILASVRGYIVDVFPHEGVRIETPAAQIYGIIGVGEERSGVLQLLVTAPDEPITPEMIDARSAYAIIIGGSTITAAGLRRAVQEQVRGVIVGSIAEPELRAFAGGQGYDIWRTDAGSWQLGLRGAAPELTLVVTEGFGDRPMAAPLFDVLAAHDRQEALISGITQIRAPQRRPTVVIPLSLRTTQEDMEPPRPILRVGAQVRLLDQAHLGQTAMVRSLSQAPRRLDSRARAQAADVELADGTRLLLPQTALEVLL